jgi:hypothetical protein
LKTPCALARAVVCWSRSCPRMRSTARSSSLQKSTGATGFAEWMQVMRRLSSSSRSQRLHPHGMRHQQTEPREAREIAELRATQKAALAITAVQTRAGRHSGTLHHPRATVARVALDATIAIIPIAVIVEATVLPMIHKNDRMGHRIHHRSKQEPARMVVATGVDLFDGCQDN